MKRALLAAALVMGAGLASADTYKVDNSHALIGFRVSHLVISKVNGQFKEYDASLELSQDGKLTAAKATIKAASIDTGIADRDTHLRSADFLDTEKHPEITFATKKVTEKNLIGDLTIRGVTKEVVLSYTLSGPIKDPWGNTKIGLEAAGTISRKDFGLTWSKLLESGGAVVGDEVEIKIDVEAAKQ